MGLVQQGRLFANARIGILAFQFTRGARGKDGQCGFDQLWIFNWSFEEHRQQTQRTAFGIEQRCARVGLDPEIHQHLILREKPLDLVLEQAGFARHHEFAGCAREVVGDVFKFLFGGDERNSADGRAIGPG